MNIPRICVSATHGSCGKTLLSLGLGRKLRDLGLKVKPFKKGPDYIDAAWLSQACGTPATNLDLFFTPAPDLRQLFGSSAESGEFALIEGNRGLYDGMDERGSYSTAELARTLNAPLLLCVDCSKTTRTMAAVLKGLTGFEEGLDFRGVVLNRVASSRHETALAKAIEAHTDLEILGAIPRNGDLTLPERHMGLARSGYEDAEKFLDRAASIVGENCDIDKIIASASGAPPIEFDKAPLAPVVESRRPVIGYVRDRAFWFYYPENLDALVKVGAVLVPLSIADRQSDEANWERVSGLYIGGGFPEDFGAEIAASPRLAKLRRFADEGMPIYAECGGLIALCESLEKDGRRFAMGGVLPERIVWRPRPRGLGYIQGQVVAENIFFPKGLILRGHEFHYSEREAGSSRSAFGLSLARGTGFIERDGERFDALVKNNVWASFAHIFAPAVPCWAKNFVSAARKYRDSRRLDKAD